MKDHQYQFLQLLGQLPPRLTAEQTAWVINCQVHDIPSLVTAKLLKPLGNPSANSIKFYATEELLERCQDRKWVARVTTTIYQHWRRRRGATEVSPSQTTPTA